MTGYTFEEMSKFGFYDWTEVAREVSTDEYGCTYSDDCPCCTCGDDVAYVITYARPRWSKSQKRMVEQTDRVWYCSAHAE